MRVAAISRLGPLLLVAAAGAVVMLPGVTGTGCGAGPIIPSQGQVVVAPPSFAAWWSDVETCSGLAGDLRRVTWVEVPCADGESGFPCAVEPLGLCGGEWYPPHTIWLGGPNSSVPAGYLTDEWTVKHEMLHDLAGTPEHTSVFRDCHLLLR